MTLKRRAPIANVSASRKINDATRRARDRDGDPVLASLTLNLNSVSSFRPVHLQFNRGCDPWRASGRSPVDADEKSALVGVRAAFKLPRSTAVDDSDATKIGFPLTLVLISAVPRGLGLRNFLSVTDQYNRDYQFMNYKLSRISGYQRPAAEGSVRSSSGKVQVAITAEWMALEWSRGYCAQVRS